MKNRIIILAAAISVLAVSCQKEEIPTPVVEMEPMVITTVGEVESKTSLSGNSIIWSSDDEISVFDNANINNRFTQETAPDGAAATFAGQVAEGTTAFYAVYPYNTANKAENGIIYVKLPSDQTAKVGSFAEEHNISVAKGTREIGGSIVEGITFKNACGLLKFTLPNYITDATQVTVTSNSVLAGDLTINYQEDAPRVTVSSTGSKSISMTGSYKAGSTFWFVVAPGEINGITVDVKTARTTYSMSTANKYTIEAGTYKNLGTLKLSEKITGSASAQHVYKNKVLQGTNVILDLSLESSTSEYLKLEDVLKSIKVSVYYKPEDNRDLSDKVSNVIGGWLGQDWGESEPETVYIISDWSTEDIASSITVPYNNDFPYLPKDISYTVAVSYTTANSSGSFEVDLNVDAPFNDNINSIVAEYDVYTPYDKYCDGETAYANTLNGSALYADISKINISEKIMNICSDLFITTVNVDNAVTKSNGYSTVSPTKFGDNTLRSISTSFDGSPAYESKTDAGDYLITGIPYEYSFKSNKTDTWKNDGWTLNTEEGNGIGTGISLLGVDLGGMCLHSFKRSGGWSRIHSSGYAVSPKFGIEDNETIKVATNLVVFAYDSMAIVNNTYTGYVGPVAENTNSSTEVSYTIGSETTDVSKAIYGVNKSTSTFDITMSNPYISLDCNKQERSSTDLYFYIYSVRFEYAK